MVKRRFVAGAMGRLSKAQPQTEGGLITPRGFESRSLRHLWSGLPFRPSLPHQSRNRSRIDYFTAGACASMLVLFSDCRVVPTQNARHAAKAAASWPHMYTMMSRFSGGIG